MRYGVLILIAASVITYAAFAEDTITPYPQHVTFTSGIIETAEFREGTATRYLIFGENSHGFTTALSGDAGYRVIEDLKVELHNETGTPNVSGIGDVAGTQQVREMYGLDGSGIRVAIVDTGVDFSNPDLRDSLMRDPITNHPVMLDADAQGIVLTNSTFVARIQDDGGIAEYDEELPEWATSSVRVTQKGVFLDIQPGIELEVYNSFFPEAGPSDQPIFNATLDDDYRIGASPHDYIKSKSGVYRLGIIYGGMQEGPNSGLRVVPVLVVDSVDSGIYDTIIPDLSTSWKDYIFHQRPFGAEPDYDYDFTDETPVVLGAGNETLVYDSDEDGEGDYSIGTIGAHVLDVYGIFNSTSERPHILPPIDPDGEFFGIMTDTEGHGTSSAAAVASRGGTSYDIYNSTETFTITGAAPGAKIIPIKALWYGDIPHAWLWTAGFDTDDDGMWHYESARADIISNSWGVPQFPSSQEAPGADTLSMLLSYLSNPRSASHDYPGALFVASAGNAGHGYGTISSPGASPFALTVGATTHNAFVGYGTFEGEPRFGNSTSGYGHIVDFSSRGPGTLADPKPDVVATGAYSFVPSEVTRSSTNNTHGSFDLFGGTSMAAPIVAGSAAVVLEAMREDYTSINPHRLKSVLVSTATDTHNDAFTQGAGAINATAAVSFVKGDHGSFLVTNDATHNHILDTIRKPFDLVNATALGLEEFNLPMDNYAHTSWYAGRIDAPDLTHTTFTVENPSDESLEIHVDAARLELVSSPSYNGTTVLHQRDPVLDDEGVFAPNYVRLDDLTEHRTLSSFFEKTTIPESSLLVLRASFGLGEFMNMTANSEEYASDLRLASLYLYDWNDLNNDTSAESSELSLISRAGSWGTVQEMRITDPTSQFEGVPLVGVYPVPTRYSYWDGDTGLNSTSIKYTLDASYYEYAQWDAVWLDKNRIIVPPHGTASVRATIDTVGSNPGVHQGFVRFTGESQSTLVPVSYAIKVSPDTRTVASGDDILYRPGTIRGAFDMLSTYMAGDWQQYHFDVSDDTIDTALIDISWSDPDTSVSAFAVDPAGSIITNSAPPGALGGLLGWPSSDWLGSTDYSQGGGFYPVSGRNDTSLQVVAPINGTGTYAVMTHATIFGADDILEPLTINIKLN